MIECPTCGLTKVEQHPRKPEVQRCVNCKEWLSSSAVQPGDTVSFDDPWFYPGGGTVLRVQKTPHEAVEVRVAWMDAHSQQHWVGRDVWILTGHVHPVQ